MWDEWGGEFYCEYHPAQHRFTRARGLGVEVNAGKNVTVSINSDYENASQYYFEFGDGTDSGGINQSSISKIYDSSGEYHPKAKLRYSDGIESDWVDAGSIEVRGDIQEVDLVLMAMMLRVILAMITVLAFFTFKKRKGVLYNTIYPCNSFFLELLPAFLPRLF